MRRTNPPERILPPLYKHFTLGTLAVAALVALFAEGEHREAREADEQANAARQLARKNVPISVQAFLQRSLRQDVSIDAPALTDGGEAEPPRPQSKRSAARPGSKKAMFESTQTLTTPPSGGEPVIVITPASGWRNGEPEMEDHVPR